MTVKAFKKLSKKIHRVREKFFVMLDSSRLNTFEGPVLFIDAGANLGQGYKFFSRYFTAPRITFHLFEPNPNCTSTLAQLRHPSKNGEIILHACGIGQRSSTVNFYGLGESEGGSTSQGGSILKAHNGDRYAASESQAIQVDLIDFSDYLQKQSVIFKKIILKMDIEGAEVPILNHLIARGTHRLIDIIYLEFHSQYLREMERAGVARKEVEIERALRQSGVQVRIWH